MFRLFEHNNKNESTPSFSGLFKKLSVGTAVAAANLISQVYSAENSEPGNPDFEVTLNHTLTFPYNDSYSIGKLSCWSWVPKEYWANFTNALLTCSNTLINNIRFDDAYHYFIHRKDWVNPNIYCAYETSDPMDFCTQSIFQNYVEYPSLPAWQPLTPLDPALDPAAPHPSYSSLFYPVVYTFAGLAVSAIAGFYVVKKCFRTETANEENILDPVLYNIMKNPMKLDCGHRLDHTTLEQLIPNNEGVCTCPLCRAPIKNPKPDNEFKELISDFKAQNNKKLSTQSMFSSSTGLAQMKSKDETKHILTFTRF